MSQTLIGLELYEHKKVKTALFGIFLGVISGITGTLNGIINGITVDLATAGIDVPNTVLISMMMVVGVLGVVDVVNGVFMFIYNTFTGRGFSEYKRTLKLPVSWIMLGTAFIVGPFGQGLYYTGIVMCGATAASAIVALAPMITAILSRIIFKETLGVRVFVGIAIIIIGTVSTSAIAPEGSSFFYIGLLLSFIAAIAFALEGILGTYAADMIDPYIGCGFFRSLICGFLELLMAIIIATIGGGLSLFGTVVTALFSPSILPLTLLMGLIMAVSYATIYGGFVKAGPGRTLAGVYTIPIWSIPITLIMSIIVPKYCSFDLSLTTGIGACIVGVGAVLVVCRPSELVNLREH